MVIYHDRIRQTSPKKQIQESVVADQKNGKTTFHHVFSKLGIQIITPNLYNPDVERTCVPTLNLLKVIGRSKQTFSQIAVFGVDESRGTKLKQITEKNKSKQLNKWNGSQASFGGFF